jgi:hypothetical protein
MVKCITCNKEFNYWRKESAGVVMTVSIIPMYWLLGINFTAICYYVGMLGFGLKWIITKPSLKFECIDCRSENKKYWA